ncbi:MAG: bifunctional diaminohydroxyphosphoribosylaminopyrimidine deaminase/5-amino-6-(5-phosphoribosylamino)uracil reductase RibD [Opitutaceae bacterium]
MNSMEKQRIMARCLELARKGWGLTHPNPMVGAAIVENGEIVAEGWHEQAGGHHAEVAALKALGRLPNPGAILFCTLEPCSTTGRTGPCTEAIVEAGIRHVVVGATDPNPAHAGAGLEWLKTHGVTVETRVLIDECEDLNLIFNHWITKGLPLFAGKIATTIDGRIATRTGQSQWITGESSRADVMRWRRLFPAIAIGAGTVLKDQPRLTSRIDGLEEWSPIRFVFDGLLRTAMERILPTIYTDEFKTRTVVVTTNQAGTGYARRIEMEGARAWILPSPNTQVPMVEFRKRCVDEGIVGVYFEGGPRLLSEIVRERQLDYLFSYRAPILFGDDRAPAVVRGLRTEKLEQALRLENVHHETFDGDELMRGRLVYPGRLNVDEAVFGLG